MPLSAGRRGDADLRETAFPGSRETPDAPANVPGIWVGNLASLLDQLHRAIGGVTLRNQDGGRHHYRSVPANVAVCVYFAARVDRSQRGSRPAPQRSEWNRQQWIVERAQPEGWHGRVVRVRGQAVIGAHIDHELHTQGAQGVVIVPRRGDAYEKRVGNL